MYKQWYGKGQYADVPVPGGLDTLELKYQTKWRRAFNDAQKQHFSRLGRVIKGIKNRMSSTGSGVDDVLQEFDGMYLGECKKKLTKFVTKLKELGYLEMKENGSKKN